MIKRVFIRRAALTTMSVALLLLLLLSATSDWTSAARVSSTPLISVVKFDPDGEFPLYGKAPKGLEEVSTIPMWGRGRHNFMNKDSGVYTTAGVIYRFRTVSVAQQKFTFSTVARRGTSYSFTGRFLRGGVFAELDSEIWDQPILEGTMTKLKNGKKVAEASMKFSYFGGT
jgi:hypothetical protein